MKKILLFLISSVLFPLFSNAQMESTEYYAQDKVGYLCQKIEAYKPDIFITLSMDQNSVFKFYYVREGMPQILSIDAPAGYTITDIKILGDTLYFSGYHYLAAISSDVGVIGHFAINDLFFNNGIYFAKDIIGTTTINRIETYYDPSDPNYIHIVGIGQTNVIAGTIFKRDCFIECNNKTNYPNWEYTIDLSQYNLGSQPAEYITDIAVVDKFVTTVGRIMNYSGGNFPPSYKNIVVRKYDKGNPADLLSQQQRWYDLGIGNPTIMTPVDNRVFAEGLYNYNIAVATSSADNNAKGALIHNIDLMNFSMIYSQKIDQIEKSQIRDLEFCPEDNKLLLVQDVSIFPTETEKSLVYYLDFGINPTMPYLAKADFLSSYYPNFPLWNSIIRNKDYHYTVVGYDPHLMLSFFSKNRQLQTPNSCNKFHSIKVDSQPTGVIYNMQALTLYINTPFIWTKITPKMVNQIGKIINCYN